MIDGYKENIHPEVIFQELNLVKDSNHLTTIFNHYKPDYVFHFAAYRHQQQYHLKEIPVMIAILFPMNPSVLILTRALRKT